LAQLAKRAQASSAANKKSSLEAYKLTQAGVGVDASEDDEGIVLDKVEE